MSVPTFYKRWVEGPLVEAMADTPVVLLVGPRQAGKTTLVRQMAEGGARYLTLDDELTRLSAREDPVGFIRSLDRAVIDEVQRAPELLLAIKKVVDEDRRPGRFLLTGSANLMLLPTVADSLAGRMETLTLLPLAQGEIEGHSTNWLDCVFEGRIPLPRVAVHGDVLVERVLRGGYPEACARSSVKRRNIWARQYLDAIIQRDVRYIASIEKRDHLPRFLRALAQGAGQLCRFTELGGQVGLDGKTVARYIGILEQMYLLRRVEVWARNRLKRLVKTPKLQFIDSGLLAVLLGMSAAGVQSDRTRFGNVLETFVYGELLKHATVALGDYQVMGYRDTEQFEVDLVIENPRGEIVGVEVKASATVRANDLRGLKKLAHLAGGQFKMGILLYDGDEVLPLGDHIWAAPIASLWGK